MIRGSRYRFYKSPGRIVLTGWNDFQYDDLSEPGAYQSVLRFYMRSWSCLGVGVKPR